MSNFNKKTGSFSSSNGIDTIYYTIYAPKGEIKAILQLSHGMCEYVGRYEEFADFLAGKGILLCGNDHLGHGRSISSIDKLGYFAREDGWTFPSKDLYLFTCIIKRIYHNIPYFLFGHSMGSFFARKYLAEFGDELDGAIISGTSGGEFFSPIGKLITKYVILTKGEKFRSEQLENMLFSTYNNKIQDNSTKFDWLTRDKEIVDKYVKDKKCNFIFTARGFLDLITILQYVSRRSWIENLATNLPILLISGDCDPVGGYGDGVKKLYNKLISADIKAELKIFEGGRHEIINETNREEVYQYVYNWICEKLKCNGD